MFKEQLLNSFLKNNSLSSLAEAMSGLLGCPVIIVDDAFHIAASFAAKGYDYEAYKMAVSHSELSFEAAAEISGRAERTKSGSFAFERDGKCYSVTLLDNGGVMTGYMILVLEKGETVKADEEELVFAAALFSKQLCLERRQTAANTAEEVLISLLDGEFSDEEHFRLQASATFLSNFHPEKFAVAEISGDSSDISNDFLRRNLESGFHGSHPFFYRNRVVMFLHKDHNLKRLKETAESSNLSVAVSQRLDGVFSLGGMYPAAAETLDYLRAAGESGFLVQSCDYARLIALKKLDKQSELIAPEINALCVYDCKNSSELCLTLYTYLICHRSLKQTCEKLYTHRNTVLYRIRKIKEDFGIIPEKPENHFKYLLSCALALSKNGMDELFID